MKKTAYLLLDNYYEPREVYMSKDIAESRAAMMPCSVVEVAYAVPEVDTWERIEEDAHKLDAESWRGSDAAPRVARLVARCRKLAGADE